MTRLRRDALRRPAALVLACVLLAVAVPALADPSSDEVRSRLQAATDRLDEIEEKVAAAVEDFHEAEMALEAASEELAEAQARLDQLQADAALVAELVGDHARRLHKLGPTVELSSIFVASDPSEASDRMATLRRLLDGQQADLESLEALRSEMAATEERLAVARDDAEQRAAEVEERRQELEATLAAHEQEVSRLRSELAAAIEREEAERRRREEERRRREAERRRQLEAERAREAEAAVATTTTTSSSDSGSSSGESAPAARKSAQVAVDTAMAQLGKPYRWGGGGPDSFDCSGLTSFAWRAAGVTLPRSSRAQYAATTRISRSELQPGDLVFYHNPISHVAMYIGGTKVVEAPFSGNSVRIRHDGLTRRGIVGYGRP